MLLCSIFDTIAQEYGPPFLSKNQSVAIRQFENMFLDEKTENVKHIHKEDYRLYRLGTIDTNTGIVVSCVKEIAKVPDTFEEIKDMTDVV